MTISMSKFSYLQEVLMHLGSRNDNVKFSILMYDIHSTFSLLHWVTERFQKNVTVFEIKTYLTTRVHGKQIQSQLQITLFQQHTLQY